MAIAIEPLAHPNMVPALQAHRRAERQTNRRTPSRRLGGSVKHLSRFPHGPHSVFVRSAGASSSNSPKFCDESEPLY